jgi:16S rRNA (cytosine1402-N4)-methyltransferase
VQTVHEGVLVKECVEGLGVKPGGAYVDLTGGGGGHATAVWKAQQGIGTLVVLDQDEEAVGRLVERFGREGVAARVLHANFREVGGLLSEFRGRVDGMIADLGLSSDQLERPERGFSFARAGRLDMRMDRRSPLTAESIVNEWSEEALAELFFTYGEERESRRIARAIVRDRARARLATTEDLAQLVSRVSRARYGGRSRRHPATRVFQALRIATNAELEAIQALLAQAPDLLRPGGRLAVISFHSLEDRLVKHAFRQAPWTAVTRRPILPSDAEVEGNPRARSAKLRIGERRQTV